MKTSVRMLCLTLLVSLVWIPGISAHEGEDHAKLQQVMQKAETLSWDINYTLQEKDYFATAKNLMELAQSFKSLESTTPAKGTKQEWDAIHNELIRAAFKAIGACGEENDEAVEFYTQQIAEFMKNGHGIFK